MKLFKYQGDVDLSLDGKEYWISKFIHTVRGDIISTIPTLVKIIINKDNDHIYINIIDKESGELVRPKDIYSQRIDSNGKPMYWESSCPEDIEFFDTEKDAKQYYNSKIIDYINKFNSKVKILKTYYIL